MFQGRGTESSDESGGMWHAGLPPGSGTAVAENVSD